MILVNLLLLLALYLNVIVSLPILKPIKYSIQISKPFHPLNFENVLVKRGDQTLFVRMTPQTEGQYIENEEDLYQAELTEQGQFVLNDASLKIGENDQLLLSSKINNDFAFNINNGHLSYNGQDSFKCCSLGGDIYSIHLNTENFKCENQQLDVSLNVFDEFGLQKHEFEPELFLYEAGKFKFL
ncbi:hypothetical protein WICMUC_003391 [Wickerhamomyces mucosus]|uniref:Uncharacterized protein n=1 Tax=Wickerhamomyces mucosus TaxID=1378264 RepID=A0A9P8PMV5_9ASCO|nr:hypothetical protein WICMUC_003391 [Wickerhamomyces mucosus]